MIRETFAGWGLTGTEVDVGLLALKGLNAAEIAAMRGSAQGTVRAQLTKIYAKAGVSNRAQFAALFVEDLLGGRLIPQSAAAEWQGEPRVLVGPACGQGAVPIGTGRNIPIR